MRQRLQPQRIAPKLKAITELATDRDAANTKLNGCLLAYARAAKVPLDQIVDDELELTF